MAGVSNSYIIIFILLVVSQISYIKIYTSKSIIINDKLKDENRSFVFSTINAFISLTMGLLFYLYILNSNLIIVFGLVVLISYYLSRKNKEIQPRKGNLHFELSLKLESKLEAFSNKINSEIIVAS